MIHSALAMQIVNDFASGLQYVFAGSQHLPESSTFKMFTEGCIHQNDPTFPIFHSQDKWTPILFEPVLSAYFAFLERRTNIYSSVPQEDILHSIFISRNIQVVNLFTNKLQDLKQSPDYFGFTLCIPRSHFKVSYEDVLASSRVGLRILRKQLSNPLPLSHFQSVPSVATLDKNSNSYKNALFATKELRRLFADRSPRIFTSFNSS
jgi:hypothetical protein